MFSNKEITELIKLTMGVESPSKILKRNNLYEELMLLVKEIE